MIQLPRIVSVDDHVIEPAHVWQQWLPSKYRAEGPRLERQRGVVRYARRRNFFHQTDDGDWADIWVYDGAGMPLVGGMALAGTDRSQSNNDAFVYESIRPGAYDQTARLADMDANHQEAGLCFPSFPRFCGQTFLEATDKDLALACVQAYNDWMIEEWCGGAGAGRLLPVTIIPLWDVELAAAEVRRCAAKGNTSFAFSENPSALDLPSIHSGAWDPLWAACAETATVVNCHIGSSSTVPRTSPDAPLLTTYALLHEGSERCLADWLCSGVFDRFDSLRLALSEGGIGWMPFFLDRIDYTLAGHGAYLGVSHLKKKPSDYVEGHIYGCLVDDAIGLRNRDRLVTSQIMFEVDFPHGDSHWPNSLEAFQRLANDTALTDEEAHAILRNNAIDCYGLDRFGLEKSTPSAADAVAV
jgi:predicted TIM-barrel fold metal-dependent hydrolase